MALAATYVVVPALKLFHEFVSSDNSLYPLVQKVIVIARMKIGIIFSEKTSQLYPMSIKSNYTHHGELKKEYGPYI